MTKPKPLTAKEDKCLTEMIEAATGIKIADLDKERRVTFYDVSMRRELAMRRYWETRDPKHLRAAQRCKSLLAEMVKRLENDQSLYLRPSELTAWIAGDDPTDGGASANGGGF